MTLRVLRRADHVRMPWRNGGGETLEVARHPVEGEFDWRISFAFVGGDGPFSSYPGVDRHLTLVRGEAMHLTIDGGENRTLRPHEPFAFPGEWAIDCRVPAPTVDLNLMTRRGVVAGAVRTIVVPAGGDAVVEPTGVAHLAVLAGRASVRTQDGDSCELAPLDVLARFVSPLTVASAAESPAATPCVVQLLTVS